MSTPHFSHEVDFLCLLDEHVKTIRSDTEPYKNTSQSLSEAHQAKMARYHLTAADLLNENDHLFVDLAKLGIANLGKSCLVCGIMRRADGQNKPCNGTVNVTVRDALKENHHER
jgi:hypothetical protein